MPKIFLILFFIFVFLILLFPLFIHKKPYGRPTKTNGSVSLIPSTKEQECNPDINTKNWDLHKNRLKKFGRSQYKGLTFFVSAENRIYYLSEQGNKVYC